VLSPGVVVHLFDGTYELFRAWFGAPPAQHNGREVGAARVVLRSLAGLLGRGGVTHAGVAYDHVIESFRNVLFADYKTGEGIDERLFSQFELAERAAASLGLVVWPMIDFEADDAIATAAARNAADPAVDKVVIAAVDKDMCQCRDRRARRVLGSLEGRHPRRARGDRQARRAAASIPDLLALVGDTADGIPGLPGWGKSSAAKVLSVWKTIAAIPTIRRSGTWPACAAPSGWPSPCASNAPRRRCTGRWRRCASTARSRAMPRRCAGAAPIGPRSRRSAPSSASIPA